MFTTVLVANRGEIAVRVIRTLRALGVRSVAVYSDADRDARHVALADDAVHIGPTAASASYLDVERIVGAALATGAEAIHPGYGFLSENASLAGRCADVGVAFVGPPVRAIEVMGDKINAKQAVAAAGVPVVPGRSEAGLSDAELEEAAIAVGLPVLLKPSAGGGGKGMRRVDDPARLGDEIVSARREARNAFGDDTLFVERWVTRPRHIEIQVLADALGGCVHLGERECSLQRRHQKIVEEAPSVLLDEATRQSMGASAVAAARTVGYVGAGTVEFIVSAGRPDDYFFMEMNTRLQVEHPVTEAVTGLDLVEWQLRVAAGEALGFAQQDVRIRGHAVEARVYAEDPSRGFLPSTGTVLALHEPSGLAGVRVDSGLALGTVVGTAYDPMLAKVVAHGADRAEALARLDAALGQTTVLGVATNLAFLRCLLRHPDVASGDLDTELVEREGSALTDAPMPDEILAAVGLHHLLGLEASPRPGGGRRRLRGRRGGGTSAVDPWDIPGGWRVGEHAETLFALTAAGAEHVVGVRGRAGDAVVRVDDGPARRASAGREGGHLVVDLDGRRARYRVAVDGDVVWIGRDGAAWAVARNLRHDGGDRGAAGAAGPVVSPMPGSVISVLVAVGDVVTRGQPLLSVEAMKMEYAVTAPADGTVAAVHVQAGEQVTLDQELIQIDHDPGAARQ